LPLTLGARREPLALACRWPWLLAGRRLLAGRWLWLAAGFGCRFDWPPADVAVRSAFPWSLCKKTHIQGTYSVFLVCGSHSFWTVPGCCAKSSIIDSRVAVLTILLRTYQLWLRDALADCCGITPPAYKQVSGLWPIG